MTTSEQINELAAALAKAQGEIEGASKDSANPFFKSKYADLSSVWGACRSALSKHGLAITQSPSLDAGAVTVTTLLTHASGQWIRGAMSATPKDDGPQAIGSVITYLRRYSLQSFVGVAPEDDDAEKAEGRSKAATVQPFPTPKGFEEWVEELEAVVCEGTASLEKAWKASSPTFRKHLTTTNPAAWEAMKARAADAHQVGA